MKFVNPKNDVAFKKIFGNEQHKEVLIAFLNTVLDLRGNQAISDIQILNPYQAPKLEMLKYTLLDIRATDKRGVTFIVEMQIKNVGSLRKRFQYYVAKSYSTQIKRGEDYPHLNQVIFIGIFNFVDFSNEHYLSRHILLNCETQEHELQDFEFNFIELPKFTKQETELKTPLEKWIYFLKHANDLDVIPSHANDVALITAYKIANRFAWTEEELEVYEYWSMKDQDDCGAVELALQKGIEQGVKQGIEQGEHNKAIETASKMLAQGLSLDIVVECTGLSRDIVANL